MVGKKNGTYEFVYGQKFMCVCVCVFMDDTKELEWTKSRLKSGNKLTRSNESERERVRRRERERE